MNYQKRAAILGKFAKLLKVDIQDVFYIRINPGARLHDADVYDDQSNSELFGGNYSGTPNTGGYDGYSPAHHKYSSTDVIFGVYTYDLAQAKQVVKKAKKLTFNDELLSAVKTEVDEIE